MLKCNIVVCRCDKILVNVASYVIAGFVYVVGRSGVNRNRFLFSAFVGPNCNVSWCSVLPGNGLFWPKGVVSIFPYLISISSCD